MKLKLDDVFEAITSASDDCSYYYHTETGEVVLYLDPVVFGETDSELAEDLEDNFDKYITLPSNYEIHNYRIMERFILTLPEGEAQDKLASSIRGCSSFRRFKGTAADLDLLEGWLEFRDNAHREIAIQWCEENGIEYE